MATTTRTARYGNFAGLPDQTDGDSSTSHNATLGSTVSNGVSFSQNIWNTKVGADLPSQYREASAARPSVGWNGPSLDNRENQGRDDRPNTEVKPGQITLKPASGIQPWGRRASAWGSAEANGSSTSAISQYDRRFSVAAFPEQNQKNVAYTTNGQSSTFKSANPRTPTFLSGLVPSAENGLSMSNSFPDFEMLQKNDNRPINDQIVSWADNSSLPSPADDRRSNYSDNHGSVSAGASHKGSLPPSRNGLESGQTPQTQDGFSRFQQPSSAPYSRSFSMATSDSLPSHLGRGNPPANVNQYSGMMQDLDRFNLSTSRTNSDLHERRSSSSSNPQGVPGSLTHSRFPSVSYDVSKPSTNGADVDFRSMPTFSTHEYSDGPFDSQYTSFRTPNYNGPQSSTRRNYSMYPPTMGAVTPTINEMSPYVSRVNSPNNGMTDGHSSTQDKRLSRIQGPQDQYMPPQMHHLMASHLRTQYGGPYGYGMPPEMQMNGAATYVPMPHMMFQSVMTPRGSRDLDTGQSLRSALLEEFKSNNKSGRRYELKEIYDHVVEFSGDQHGSRFIQQKLETANSDEKEKIFREIQPNAIQLMTDVFGNYVVQKFFEHGDQNQKKILANKMKGHVCDLSMQVYGCRVVQKAIEHVLVDQQASLVKELEHSVLRCVKDQNGNHVIQKAIERVPMEHIQFIINAFIGQVQHLATHPYGCRVVQRLLERSVEPHRSRIMEELHACGPTLIADQYGNYVTQHVIEHGSLEDRAKIFKLIQDQLIPFSKQKFASNVVEKSLTMGTDEQKRDVVNLVCQKNEKGETALPVLIRDAYGNYVIQRLLDTLNTTDRTAFVELLQPEVMKAKRLAPTKHVEALCASLANLPPSQVASTPLVPCAI